MSQLLLIIAFGILCAAEVAVLWRVLTGPTMPDRLNAASLGGNILTFVLALAGAIKGSALYYEAALATALLSVCSTIILAKFVGTGEIL